MATAPLDGTVIEIQITTPVMSWSTDYRWANGRWENVGDPARSVDASRGAMWRPSTGRGFNSAATAYGLAVGLSSDGMSLRR
jgi:hypothetical protein